MIHRFPFPTAQGANVANPGENKGQPRVIKRYSNRKLYDTQGSRYVTLLQIAEMVRGGEEVQIIDNTTKEDKTDVTLALAISEELKAKPRSVPLGTLRNLIQERGGRILTSLRDGPIGRLIPEGESEPPPSEETAAELEDTNKPKEKEKPERAERTGLAELVASSRNTLDQWQHAIDERIRTVLPNFSLFLDVQSEMRRLAHRVQVLEDMVARMRVGDDSLGMEVEPGAGSEGSAGQSTGERE